MSTYTLFEGGTVKHTGEILDELVSLAKHCHAKRNGEVPYAIVDSSNKSVALFPAGRIMGDFHFQIEQHKHILTVNVDYFDATLQISRMCAEEIISIMDNDESSDSIGRYHFTWDAPHSVEISDSILEYFGLPYINLLTDEALDFAKSNGYMPVAISEKVTLTVDVDILVPKGSRDEIQQKIQDFIENLDYSVTSDTDDVVVLSTEITDC